MLKRDISGTNVLIAAVGGMIGSGWLFSPFISAQMAGGNALISWIIAAVFMLLIALPLCELGALFPISGGMANYPSFTHGSDVGFLFAWISWLSYVVMTPIEIQAMLQYLSNLFPGLVHVHNATYTLSAIGSLCAIFIMLFVVLLNSYGIRILAECNKVATFIKLTIPAITIFALLQGGHFSNNVTINLGTKNSWIEIFTALATGGIAFAFTGFQNGLILAGEVQNPQKNIPIAILGAVLIGFVLYFMLQLSFLVAVPQTYLTHGWQNLSFPGDSGPLVGLTLLLGLGLITVLLMFDAAFSPFGTTLVFTAATSRILYGMALNNHIPPFFLKLNKYNIPYITLYANFIVGLLSFLPFPGWQKMVAFLSSCSILSYSIGPICVLSLRNLQPTLYRPFRLRWSLFFCHLAFYVCNLMLYWCGFDILWKMCLAILFGLILNLLYQKRLVSTLLKKDNYSLYWFTCYVVSMLIISYFGSFKGIGTIKFPTDMVIILPCSIILLHLSQKVQVNQQCAANMLTHTNP